MLESRCLIYSSEKTTSLKKFNNLKNKAFIILFIISTLMIEIDIGMLDSNCLKINYWKLLLIIWFLKLLNFSKISLILLLKLSIFFSNSYNSSNNLFLLYRLNILIL